MLSSGRVASDVFGVHGDEVVCDDCDHGEDTECVGQRVQGVVGNHDCGGRNCALEKVTNIRLTQLL